MLCRCSYPPQSPPLRVLASMRTGQIMSMVPNACCSMHFGNGPSSYLNLRHMQSCCRHFAEMRKLAGIMSVHIGYFRQSKNLQDVKVTFGF